MKQKNVAQEEINELKTRLNIVSKQLRVTDKKYANCVRELREYQEYFRLQQKLLKRNSD